MFEYIRNVIQVETAAGSMGLFALFRFLFQFKGVGDTPGLSFLLSPSSTLSHVLLLRINKKFETVCGVYRVC